MSKITIRNLIIASTVLLLTTGVFVFMIFQIQAQGRLLVENTKTLNAERLQEDSFYKLQKVADESAGDRGKMVSYFLQEEGDTINFLNQIETLAPQVGVVLKTDSLEKSTDKATGASWVDVSISFSGEEKQVQIFIRVLERLPYLLKITSLDLGAQSNSLWEAKVKLRVFVLTYDK